MTSELTCHLDVETRSTCDLKTAGLYRYFEDPQTEALCVRWRIGDGPVREGVHQDLLDHIDAGGPMVGHNFAFDRECWNVLICPEHPISIEQSGCTMSRAAALSLPQSLEQAGKALGLKIQKDVEGHRLMMRMCKPKKVHPDGTVEWHETPEQLARLSEYCEQDVLAECAIDAAVPQLSPSEKRLWVLDQKINARGVQLDMPMVDKALAVAERAALAASEQIYDLTGGAVQRTTETAKIVKWLNARGIPAESIAKGEQDELLVRADLFDDPLARRVIELRRASAKSSVAKYRAMQRSVCKDGRVRGTLNFHGASTGRWAGRLIQPQNLPRIGDAGPDVEELHAILAAYDADEAFAVCQLNFDNPLDTLSKTLRSMLIAKPGHELIGGDYSNIEGRVNAWLAGEDWKVEAFADFDAGVGPDLYNVMAGAILGKPHDQVTKLERLCPGKVPELACGYQGALRAFQKMAGVYGVHVADEVALETVQLWRAKNPMIVKSWYAVQDAAIAAVKNPGMKVPCLSGKLNYMVARNILWCRLPSGRPMPYVAPHIESGPCKHCDGTGQVVTFTPEEKALFDECLQCRGSGWIKERVAFYGQNSTTKKWQKNSLYGGLQIENCCQGIARDILAEGMFRLEDAGYPLVLTVHDENICEVPEGFGSPEELAGLMSIVPTWAEGLPVAVSAWEDKRYVK